MSWNNCDFTELLTSVLSSLFVAEGNKGIRIPSFSRCFLPTACLLAVSRPLSHSDALFSLKYFSCLLCAPIEAKGMFKYTSL